MVSDFDGIAQLEPVLSRNLFSIPTPSYKYVNFKWPVFYYLFGFLFDFYIRLLLSIWLVSLNYQITTLL